MVGVRGGGGGGGGSRAPNALKTARSLRFEIKIRTVVDKHQHDCQF